MGPLVLPDAALFLFVALWTLRIVADRRRVKRLSRQFCFYQAKLALSANQHPTIYSSGRLYAINRVYNT